MDLDLKRETYERLTREVERLTSERDKLWKKWQELMDRIVKAPADLKIKYDKMIVSIEGDIEAVKDNIKAKKMEVEDAANAIRGPAIETGAGDKSTPGSKAGPSSNALQSAAEEMAKCGFNIFVNGSAVDFGGCYRLSDIKKALEDSVIKSWDSSTDLLKMIGKSHNASVPTTVNFNNLTEVSEGEFQKDLKDSFMPENCAVDTSTSSPAGPFFSPCAWSESEVGPLYLKLGKPDCTSQVAPMDLEIKASDGEGNSKPTATSWTVLKQGIQRVIVRMHLAGYLRYSFALATCGRLAWYIEAERRECEDKHKSIVDLNIVRIEPTDIQPIWWVITKHAEQDPHFFLTGDGPIICSSLLGCGIKPWACRVNLIGHSMSNVYAVSVGRKYGRHFGIMPKIEDADFALKVVNTGASFEREALAVEAIAEKVDEEADQNATGDHDQNDRDGIDQVVRDVVGQNQDDQLKTTMDFDNDDELREKDTKGMIDDLKKHMSSRLSKKHDGFYALRIHGTKSNRDLPGCLQWSELHGRHSVLDGVKDSWWNKLPTDISKTSDSGAIFMKVGDRLRSGVNIRNFIGDVHESLRFAHQANILHCDIRTSNVMKFGSKWQLIDYSLSVKADSEGNYTDLIPSSGSQWDFAGERVRKKAKSGQSFKWTKEDDYEMMGIMTVEVYREYTLSSASNLLR